MNYRILINTVTLKRITSWVLRFVDNIKKKIKKSEACLAGLKVNELKTAEEYLIKSNKKKPF